MSKINELQIGRTQDSPSQIVAIEETRKRLNLVIRRLNEIDTIVTPPASGGGGEGESGFGLAGPPGANGAAGAKGDTGDSGAKIPLVVAADEIYTVPEGFQYLWAEAISVDGLLLIDGLFIGVR